MPVETAPGAAPGLALAPLAPVGLGGTASTTETATMAPASAVPGVQPADSDDGDDDDATASDDGAEGDEEGEEAEAHAEDGVVPNDHFYTSDLSDSELQKVWATSRASLGPISVGFTDAGRLINGEPFPAGGPWVVISPSGCWGTRESIDFLTTAIRAVDAQYPGGPPARVNDMSQKEGGYLRPHESHQTGRDVDIGFYYRTDPGPRPRDRARYMDLPRNWSLIRNLVTQTDVQMILVDKHIQKTLIDYALSIGEDRQWLDSLFHAGAKSLVKHARHHRDHFHVRFFNARAQELGRRIQPLLAKDKNEHSTIAHHIKRGETLGHIAMHYGVPVSVLRKINGLKNSIIRAGRVLMVPVRGACINCPVPPPVIVPPRRLPPPPVQLSEATPAGSQ